MKKISLLLFVVSVFPTVSWSADNCVSASKWGNGYEYSECDFLQQPKLTSAVKNFWGNPKVSGIINGNSSDGGNFILTKGVHCGKCEMEDNETNSGKKEKFVAATTDYSRLNFSCPNEDDKKYADDEAILGYVATDVSEHGAEFCLTQFTSGSFKKSDKNHAEFLVYHQMPVSPNHRNGLKCEWYCESGWGGDRCMTKGIDSVCSDISYNVDNTTITTLADVRKNYKESTRVCGNSSSAGQNYCLAQLAKTDAVIKRTAVFDYSFPKDNNEIMYQQQVVIGAVGFLDYGIKARPIQLGANGAHNQCVMDNDWTHLYAADAKDGKERTLCLRGYVLQNGNCVRACSTGENTKRLCRQGEWSYSFAFEEDKFNPEKHYRSYYAKSDCVIFKCLNGMNFSPDDNYACTVCIDKIYQGLCPTTNKCVWCGVGKCFNKSTCTCDACASVLTKDQMRFGPNKTDECWSVIDADEFRACVTGGISASSEE